MVDNNKSAANWLEHLAASLGIDAPEVALRKAYLEFDARDEDVLTRLHDALPDVRRQVIDAFYDHILKFAPTRALLSGEGALERLKRMQADYFDALTAGDYGSDYVQDRLHVGVAHQRIGLEPKWYIGAYCKYLTSFLSGIETLPGIDPRDFSRIRDALLKLVFFDMGLALDTYIHAEHQATLEQRDYAESIVCSVPIGLLALSADLRVYSGNSAIDEIFGVRHGEIAGLRLDDVISVMGLRERAQDVLTTGIPQYGITASLDSGRNLQIAITTIRYSEQDHGANQGKARLLLLIEDMTETTRLRESTLESDARARAVMDNVVDGIVTTDEQGLIESFNSAAERIFGYGAAEVLGRNVKLLMPEPYHSEHDGYLQRYLHTGQARCMGIGMREVMGRRKDGCEFPMDLATNELRIGPRRLFVGVVRDITERRRGMLELLKLSSAIDQTADSVVITDHDGVIEYVNPAFEITTGYSREEALGRKPNLVKSGQHSDAFYKRLWKIILNGEPFRGVFINLNKHGDVYYEEKTITPLRDSHGVITHFVSTGKDVTERMQAQERLNYLAHHDALTELPNRLLFMDRLRQALARAARHQHRLAVLFLDLDRFKIINDTLGHDAGDVLLQAVSQRLVNRVRSVDSVARLGGDEFAILFEDVVEPADMPPVAQEILDALNDPFMLNGREIYVTASVGISLYPDDGPDPQTLLKNADTAMYRAKAQGKNTFRFYTADMNARALERLTLENSLRRALEREEFVLHYQPQVDIRSGLIIGVEALLRWAHPQHGLIPPMEFVPLLEETGLIVPAGDWVLHTALAQKRRWHSAGYSDLRMAVNMSACQMRHPDIVQFVERIMRTVGSLSGTLSLELEITESLLMENVPETVTKLQALREMGVRLSLDDFGTGYSSLAYLKRFPINTVKIDRSFVRDITSDPDDAAIVSAVIAMAHSLKLDTVAEGVETEAQLAFLRERGCDTMQGYLFSRPVPADEIDALLVGQPHVTV